MSIPQSMPLPTWRLDEVTAESMRIWVTVLRDDNPIHVDPAASEALGYGMRTVNPGPANLAYLINGIGDAIDLEYPISLSARFVGNVFSGDSVEVVGQRDEGGTIRATLRLPDQDEIVAELSVDLAPSDR